MAARYGKAKKVSGVYCSACDERLTRTRILVGHRCNPGRVSGSAATGKWSMEYDRSVKGAVHIRDGLGENGGKGAIVYEGRG